MVVDAIGNFEIIQYSCNAVVGEYGVRHEFLRMIK
jgi:hypothetical protein